MQTRDSTASVPVELMHAVFDFFSLAELARFMRVNTRWRDTVRAHPMYWSHPQLCDRSHAATTFFLARLSAAAGKPLAISLIVSNPFIPFESPVLPLMVPHLDNLTTLEICLHISHAPAVFDVLRNPTPSLDALQLDFKVPEDDINKWDVPVLPDDILRQGVVKTLSICNIDLGCIVPPALASTRCLVYGHRFQRRAATLQSLAVAFPHVQNVTLAGTAVPFGVLVDPAVWPPQWLTLHSLTLAGIRMHAEGGIAHLPVDRVPHLTIDGFSPPLFVRVLSHLEGPLHISCASRPGRRYVIHSRSCISGTIRSFNGDRNGLSTRMICYPRSFLNSTILAPRVTSLDIVASLWHYLVPYMDKFEALSRVTIVLDTADGLVPLWMDNLMNDAPAIVCPVLRTLCLSNPVGMQRINADDVVKLLLDHLRMPRASPLELVLRGVYLPPDAREELQGLVSPIANLPYENIYPTRSEKMSGS
ncbi:hypothetical protein AURDEDRAFT_172750 [Auricularia subglabra TFB-10046 SS5]|nr:hypothetical protein AURDEDRAFT_172750 [Auricularia subglabra TFB-10046 SS5]